MLTAKCPKNPNHKHFVTVAHVTEDWIVDEHGHFIDVATPPDRQVTHPPMRGNTWSCVKCGEEAEVSE